jgi:O-antigen/teichoic acid export membrane protein
MLSRGVAKSQLAKFVDVALAFVITILLTRWLGPDGFGSYALILGWISLGGLLISLGFSEVLSKYIPYLTAESTQISGFFIPLLLIRLCLALLLAGVVKLLASTLFVWLNHSELLPYVNYVILLFLLTATNDMFWAFFIARLKIEIVLLSRILQQGAIITAVLWLARYGSSSIQSLLIVTGFAYALGTATYILAYRRSRSRNQGKQADELLGNALKFGLSAWVTSGFTFLLAEQSDVLLIGLIVQEASAVAYYKVGTALVWKTIGVITVGSTVVLASLSTLYKRSGHTGLSHGWRTFVKLSTLSVVPIYLLLGWYAPQIIALLYGPDYLPSALILRLFVALTVIPFGLLGGGLSLIALYALGRERQGLLIRVTSGLVNLILGVILIRAYGAVGAVIATGIAAIIGTSLEFLLLQRFASQQYPWAFTLKTLSAVATGSLLLIAFPVQTWYELVVAGLVYALVVSLVLIWQKPLTLEDYEMVIRISPRLAGVAALFSVVP